jgi:DNA polymerase V
MDIFDDVQEGEAGLSAVGLHAGFPNPAAGRDHQRPTRSLDQLLIKQPSSTYFFRVQGHQWSAQAIFDGDIAVVDRSLSPRDQDLIVWWNNEGELCLGKGARVAADTTWGVVRAIIHQYRARN